jgi:outer membrane protein insertion porin family
MSRLVWIALWVTLIVLPCLFAGCVALWAQENGRSQGAPGGLQADPPQPSLPADTPRLSAFAGRRVHDIQFRGAASTVDVQRLLSLIPQKADQPLDKHKLRASIQALYATGRFQDIQVAVEPAPQNQLSLVFIAKQNQFVGPVAVEGAPKHGPSGHQLVNASKLQLGELLTDERLKQAVASMQRVLEDNGFYGATITPQLTPHPDTQQVDVLFRIEASRQARVGEIKVTGDPGFSTDQIREIAKLRAGEPVTAQLVTQALQRLRKTYQKAGRLEAQASVASRAYRPEGNTVDYTLKIVRGPLVGVHVEGAHLTQAVIKRSVPIYEEGAVDDDLLNEGRRNLRDYLQTQGYFDSQVTVVRKDQPTADRTDIIFDVDRRGRHKLIAVVLEGNKYFPSDIIRDRMQIQAAGWLLEHGLFSQAMLNRDLDSIRDLYRANGFLQVNAYAEVQDDYLGKQGQMRVVLHIEEGLQTLVKELNIVGATTFASIALQNMLANVPGQPFSDSNMVADQDAIVNFYFNRGFPAVTMTYAAQPVPGEATRMAVTYTIHEGERVYVNKVLVSGLHFTRPFVVNRQIVPRPGDPLSQADLLKTQTRLYDLGIFNAVDVAVQNPEGDETYKDVLLDLTEARRYTFDYGLGFEVQTGSAQSATSPQGRTGASPRVSFDANRLNFRGRNETIFFKSHFGRLEQRALLGYEIPNWLDRQNFKFTINALYDNTLDVFTFTSQRLEGSIQVQQSLSKATTLLYRLTYRDVKVSNVVISPALIPLLAQPVHIGIPSFTYIRDTRDNPVDSRKGNYLVFDTGVTAHVLGSQANFARVLLQHSEYHAFGRKGRFVLAHSTQLGIEQPWGGPSAIVPLAERYFSGGGNSLRGFSINAAGPRDLGTGYQLGGQALFVNNLELRLPPVPLPFVGKDLSPVIFHDMGNVFASTSELFPSLVRWSQPNLAECKSLVKQQPTSSGPIPICNSIFNNSPQAVGGGIRYRTPIGPVRFDVSYNLNPPTYLINFPQPAPTLTVPAPPSPTFHVLHRVNFFFSIGQTF